MSWQIRFTPEAENDLLRLYDFLLERDLNAAEAALVAIRKGIGFLQDFPFSCRKADAHNTLLRELLIPFGRDGYVALFEIDNDETVTIIAVRHQREQDYH